MAVCAAFKKELAEVGDNDICPLRPEVGGMVASSAANHDPESTGTARFNADESDGSSPAASSELVSQNQDRRGRRSRNH